MKKFGLQLFSIRDRLTNEEDLKDAFIKIAKMGYTSVQTAGTYPGIAPEKFAEHLKNAGLEVCGTHYSYDLIKNNVEETVKYHNLLGTKYIGVGGAPSMDVFKSKENLLAFIKEFNEIAEIYAKYGFTMTYHNHATEGIKLDGKATYDYMIEGFSDKVEFCFDTYWAQMSGFNITDYIKRLSGRLPILHLKDFQAMVEYKLDGGKIMHAPRFVEVGNGNLDFKSIINASEKAGTEYFIVEDEYYSTGSSLESVETSANYIKKELLEK